MAFTRCRTWWRTLSCCLPTTSAANAWHARSDAASSLVVDAHIEVHARLTVEDGHGISVEARRRVLERHRVLHLMTHIDPGYRQGQPDSAPEAASAPHPR